MAFDCLAVMFVLGVFVCHYYERLQTQNTQGIVKSILLVSKVLFCKYPFTVLHVLKMLYSSFHVFHCSNNFLFHKFIRI